ncbi:MAG: glycoside hydrolase family 88 protein, partial [Acidobacteriota bacterium]
MSPTSASSPSALRILVKTPACGAGSSMFTYGLAWGVNHGVLDAKTYAPAAQLAWHGLTTTAVQPDGFLGY